MKNYEKIRRIQQFMDGKIVIGNLSLYDAQLDVPDNWEAKSMTITDGDYSKKWVGFN